MKQELADLATKITRLDKQTNAIVRTYAYYCHDSSQYNSEYHAEIETYGEHVWVFINKIYVLSQEDLETLIRLSGWSR